LNENLNLKQVFLKLISQLGIYFAVLPFQLAQISCNFLPPGASMGPGYVSQILISEKSQKINKSTTDEARKQICADLESLEC
jgi:hypothetical protein